MKILAIAAPHADYQADCILHGLLTSSHEVEHGPFAERMFKSSIAQKGQLYGKGYTLYTQLDPPTKESPSYLEIHNKILGHYYDLIIYTYRVDQQPILLKEVLSVYERKEILFVDGADEQTLYLSPQSGKGILFKRELQASDTGHLPISFAFPKELSRSKTSPKNNELCSVIPGIRQTYIWEGEERYYDSLSKSRFALTEKRSGWDALRHYEILFNRALPIFRNIEECPPLTLHTHNKKLYRRINSFFDCDKLQSRLRWCQMPFFQCASPRGLAPSHHTLTDYGLWCEVTSATELWESCFKGSISESVYNELSEEAYSYSLANHTTKSLVDYMISKAF